MPRLLLHGASGRMGREVLAALREEPDWRLAAALVSPGSEWLGRDVGELLGGAPLGVALGADPEAAFESGVDVVVDFSNPEALAALAPRCAERGVPLVSGTTGLGEAAEVALRRAAEHVAVLHAANFSLGVAALRALLGRAARWLLDFDVEIVELHHRGKADAPSGTAMALLEEVRSARGLGPESARFGRHGRPGPREAGEVGVMALRGGDVAGEHTVLLLGEGERLELTHRAGRRSIFARGALRAARWLLGRPAGRYGVEDVLGVA